MGDRKLGMQWKSSLSIGILATLPALPVHGYMKGKLSLHSYRNVSAITGIEEEENKSCPI